MQPKMEQTKIIYRLLINLRVYYSYALKIMDNTT